MVEMKNVLTSAGVLVGCVILEWVGPSFTLMLMNDGVFLVVSKKSSNTAAFLVVGSQMT